MMKRHLFILAGIVIALASCRKKPGSYPPEPQIYYQGTLPNTIDLRDTVTKVSISLKFNDGDGDIGTDPEEQKKNIFIKDSRDTSASDFTFSYPFPFIDQYMRPKDGGLEGFISINLGKEYFSVVDSLHIALRKDTARFTIYVEDDAGNKSNVVQSDPIYIEF